MTHETRGFALRAAIFHSGRSLTGEQLYDASRRCPICLAEDPRPAVARLSAEPPIELLRCDRCGGVSASLMPRPEVLSDLYSTYFALHEEKITFDEAPRMARHILQAVGPTGLGRSVRILDYGGGDGSLALALGRDLRRRDEAAEVEIVVVDHAEAPDVREPRLTRTSVRELGQTAGPFDLVIASAVLEHVPELNPVLRTLFDSVAPGGFFYSRTPYVLPFLKIFPGMDFTYPFHVHDLGQPFWSRVRDVFGVRAAIIASRPSIVETTLSRHPLRTLAAYALKLPARVEQALFGQEAASLRWRWVGGWEVVFRFDSGR